MKRSDDTVLVLARPTILEQYVSSPTRRGCTVKEALEAAQKQDIPQNDPERLRSRQQLAREMQADSWSVFAETGNGKTVELDPKQTVHDLPADVLVPREVGLPDGEVVELLTLKLEVQSYQAVGSKIL